MTQCTSDEPLLLSHLQRLSFCVLASTRCRLGHKEVAEPAEGQEAQELAAEVWGQGREVPQTQAPPAVWEPVATVVQESVRET